MAKVNDNVVSIPAEVLEHCRNLFEDSRSQTISDIQTEIGILIRSKEYEASKDEPNKDRLRFIESQEKRLNRILKFVEHSKFYV